jgi:predicted transcriptional regulator
MHSLPLMKTVAPEVLAIQADAKAHGIKMTHVLKSADVAMTTWWRWRNGGLEPKLSTFRRVRQELDRRIAANDAAPVKTKAA